VALDSAKPEPSVAKALLMSFNFIVMSLIVQNFFLLLIVISYPQSNLLCGLWAYLMVCLATGKMNMFRKTPDFR